jgi:hypothetical protein
LPKFKETLCEVCGKPVAILSEYAEKIKGKQRSPRAELERQLNMTEEEKAERQRFFEELFESTTPTNSAYLKR